MKRLISIVTVLLLVLSFCGCADTADQLNTEAAVQTEGLQIGYGRESIMPDGKVNIAGASNAEHRESNGFLDILYASCIAVSENGTTVLLYSVDILGGKRAVTEEARKLISEATGVPEMNIQIAGTHTHSGPAIGTDTTLMAQYKPTFMNALVNAARNAIADQVPATLYGKKVQTEKMNFIRHYKMSDGTYAGSNFGSFTGKEILDYAAEADPEMILIRIAREGKKDILMMNFQAHPCFAGNINYNSLSADYIGAARTAVEAAADVHFIYFLGATGNHATSSKISGDNGPHNNDMKLYGEALAKYAIDALPAMTTPLEGTGIKTSQKNLVYNSNDYGQDRLKDAQKVAQLYKENGNSSVCNGVARSMGFQSVFECNGIVACSKYPATGDMELNTCSFGGISFVIAPYEMFSANGMYIKENSPFEFTVIATVANQGNGYYPTREAYAYGCYESYTARFASGVAEDVAAEFVEMLKEIQ